MAITLVLTFSATPGLLFGLEHLRLEAIELVLFELCLSGRIFFFEVAPSDLNRDPGVVVKEFTARSQGASRPAVVTHIEASAPVRFGDLGGQ